MIVRMEEVRARPGRVDAYCDLVAGAWPAMTAAEGFEGGELYRSWGAEEDRVVLLTRWRDERALAGFAGPDWATTARVGAAEEPLLARPPHVWHFRPVPVPPAG